MQPRAACQKNRFPCTWTTPTPVLRLQQTWQQMASPWIYTTAHVSLILEFNDSLSQGAVPKHEAVTEIDLRFSLISGLFCLPCYLDHSKFRSVALLKNPAVKPETLPRLVQRLSRSSTAKEVQIGYLCV